MPQHAVTVQQSTRTVWAMYHGSILSLNGQVCEYLGRDLYNPERYNLRVCSTLEELRNVRAESFTVLT